jgi:histidinol dehydrogenase
MRILDLSRRRDRAAIDRLLRREALVRLTGRGSRAALTRRVFGRDLTPEQVVDRIVDDVRRRGDAALFAYTRKLDGFRPSPSNIAVTPGEIRRALSSIPRVLRRDLALAIANVRAFHRREMPKDWYRKGPATSWGQRWTPLDRVGLYVPGGLAAYPSSVIMNVVPAKVAGVREIVLVTPVKADGKVNPVVLAAAALSGADRILKIGGAQAVAALAHGTRCVPAVDKITGPGNLFVALAKRKVYGTVGIDSIAGPSEILILSDGSVPAAWAAADLLSQAEHDEMASCLMVTSDARYAAAVAREVGAQLAHLDRKGTAEASLATRGGIIVARGRRGMLDLCNRYAPEHLEIQCRNPRSWLRDVRHAGVAFLGPLTPVAFGDFTVGTNHVLPTGGTARFSSGLSVFDFLKRVNVAEVRKAGFRSLEAPTVQMAFAEGLTAHAESVLKRAGSARRP